MMKHPEGVDGMFDSKKNNPFPFGAGRACIKRVLTKRRI
jgi:hypothetical protein